MPRGAPGTPSAVGAQPQADRREHADDARAQDPAEHASIEVENGTAAADPTDLLVVEDDSPTAASSIEPGGASARAARPLDQSAEGGSLLDEAPRCAFWFVHADKLRGFQGKTPPRLQEVRREHPDWLEQQTISFREGCDGAFERSTLVVSHRWEKKEEPDPDGVQFGVIKAYLEKHRGIKRVWFEYVAAPRSLARVAAP